MWLAVGVVSGLVLAAVSLLRLAHRRPHERHIDVGAVSESWLAEQRGKTSDS